MLKFESLESRDLLAADLIDLLPEVDIVATKSSRPSGLTVSGEYAYFEAVTENGKRLLKTDGDTVIDVGRTVSDGDYLAANGGLYFIDQDGRSTVNFHDGTGTTVVFDAGQYVVSELSLQTSGTKVYVRGQSSLLGDSFAEVGSADGFSPQSNPIALVDGTPWFIRETRNPEWSAIRDDNGNWIGNGQPEYILSLSIGGVSAPGVLTLPSDHVIAESTPVASVEFKDGLVMLMEKPPVDIDGVFRTQRDLVRLDSGGYEVLVEGSSASEFTVVRDRLYFRDSGVVPCAVFTCISNDQLWVTDGTAPGTKMVVDFAARDAVSTVSHNGEAHIVQENRASETSAIPNLSWLTEHDGYLYASTTSGLWRHDGENVQLLHNVDSPSWLASTSEGLVFSSRDKVLRAEDVDLVMLGELPSDLHSPLDLIPFHDSILVSAYDANVGFELFSLGSGDTSLITDINEEQYQVPRGFLSDITPLGDRVFFRYSDGIHGVELWVSDGTRSGTYIVKDIFPGSGGGSPRNMFAHGDLLYFSANDGVHGYEAWRSDGTAKGTFMIDDTRVGSESGVPHSFQGFGDNVIFIATTYGNIAPEDDNPVTQIRGTRIHADSDVVYDVAISTNGDTAHRLIDFGPTEQSPFKYEDVSNLANNGTHVFATLSYGGIGRLVITDGQDQQEVSSGGISLLSGLQEAVMVEEKYYLWDWDEIHVFSEEACGEDEFQTQESRRCRAARVYSGSWRFRHLFVVGQQILVLTSSRINDNWPYRYQNDLHLLTENRFPRTSLLIEDIGNAEQHGDEIVVFSDRGTFLVNADLVVTELEDILEYHGKCSVYSGFKIDCGNTSFTTDFKPEDIVVVGDFVFVSEDDQLHVFESFPTADLDRDGIVGFSDFLILSGEFGGSPNRADLNGDGNVDFADFLVLAEEFGA